MARNEMELLLDHVSNPNGLTDRIQFEVLVAAADCKLLTIPACELLVTQYGLRIGLFRERIEDL